MDTADEINAKIDELNQEKEQLNDRFNGLLDQLKEIEADDPLIPSMQAELQQILNKIKLLNKGLEDNERTKIKLLGSRQPFTRADKGYPGLVNGLLPPLSPNATVVEVDVDKMATLPAMTNKAIAAGLLVGGVIFILSAVLQFELVSVFKITTDFLAHSVGDVMGYILAAAVLLAVGIFATAFSFSGHRPRYSAGKAVEQIAMENAQRFIMGSENWNITQRIQASIAFGLSYFGYLIIFSIPMLIGYMVLGATLMSVYVNTHHKTGDTAHSLQVVTKFTTTFNCVGLVGGALFVVILIGYSIFL